MCTELLLEVNVATKSLYSRRQRGAIPFTIRDTRCEAASEIELRDPQGDENQTCPGRFAEKNTDKDVQSRVWWLSRVHSRRRFVGLLLLHLPLLASVVGHCRTQIEQFRSPKTRCSIPAVGHTADAERRQ